MTNSSQPRERKTSKRKRRAGCPPQSFPPRTILLNVGAVLISLTEYIKIVVRTGFPDRITMCFPSQVSSALFGGARVCLRSQ